MTATLADLAHAAGLLHPEVLQLANPALPTPKEQLADLKARWPAAFTRHARDMTPEEYQAARADAVKRKPRLHVIAGGKHASDMTAAELNAALGQIGARRPHFTLAVRR